MKPAINLSAQQARKLVLHAQKLPPGAPKGKAINSTLSAIEHLGYVQIDTISVIQRAHHHTLWNRNPRYKSAHLHNLLLDKKVFEYWSHAAAYLPMKNYRYSLSRKKAIAEKEQEHWYKRDEKMMKYVLDRIRHEGPLMAKDFEHRGDKIDVWSSKPAKQALENLFMEGTLMAPYRINFQKVYDLPERVLPTDIDTSIPDSREQGRFLVSQYLKANGIGKANEMSYLLKNVKPFILNMLNEMMEEGELLSIQVKDNEYYALPDSLELLDYPLRKSKLKILSPFDNLVIQRKRLLDLFQFDYLLECYVPAAKRKYGYFCLPILWDGKFIARMDCKADRKTGIMHIQHLILEPKLKKIEAFILALEKELANFMKFNQSERLVLHKTTPSKYHSLFSSKLFVS